MGFPKILDESQFETCCSSQELMLMLSYTGINANPTSSPVPILLPIPVPITFSTPSDHNDDRSGNDDANPSNYYYQQQPERAPHRSNLLALIPAPEELLFL
jgi:hypothetical protein